MSSFSCWSQSVSSWQVRQSNHKQGIVRTSCCMAELMRYALVCSQCDSRRAIPLGNLSVWEEKLGYRGFSGRHWRVSSCIRDLCEASSISACSALSSGFRKRCCLTGCVRTGRPQCSSVAFACTSLGWCIPLARVCFDKVVQH